MEANRRRNVIERICREQLVDEPQALLGEGEGRSGLPGHGHDARRLQPLAGLLDRLAKPSHGRRREELRQRQLDLERLPHPGDELRRQKRMTAQLEEIAVDSQLVDA